VERIFGYGISLKISRFFDASKKVTILTLKNQPKSQNKKSAFLEKVTLFLCYFSRYFSTLF